MATKKTDLPEIAEAEVLTLRPDQMKPWPGLNPRSRFDPQELAELEETIRTKGVLLPLVVHYPLDEGEAEDGETAWVVAGERRWRAASKVRPDTPVTVVARSYTLEEALEVALIENLERSDLSQVEEARGLARWLETSGLSQRDAADRLGQSQSWISNRIRLLELPEPIQELIVDGWIPATMARDVLLRWRSLTDDELRAELWGDLAGALGKAVKKAKAPPLSEEHVHQVLAGVARQLSWNLSTWGSRGARDAAVPHGFPKDKRGRCKGCTCGVPKYRPDPTYVGTEGVRCFDNDHRKALIAKVEAEAKRREEAAAERQESEEERRLKADLERYDQAEILDSQTLRQETHWSNQELVWPASDHVFNGKAPETYVTVDVDTLDPAHLYAALRPLRGRGEEEAAQAVRGIYSIHDPELWAEARQTFEERVREEARRRRKVQAQADAKRWGEARARGDLYAAFLALPVMVPGQTGFRIVADLLEDLDLLEDDAPELPHYNGSAAQELLPPLLAGLSSTDLRRVAKTVVGRVEAGFYYVEGPDRHVPDVVERSVARELAWEERDKLATIVPEAWGWGDLTDPLQELEDADEEES